MTVDGSGPAPVPDTVELAAYFVVAEALTNVVKHSSATEASVILEHDEGTFRVIVRDSGVGGAHIAPEAGLAGLRDRLEALEARLTIVSEPEEGTTICAEFPCAS